MNLKIDFCMNCCELIEIKALFDSLNKSNSKECFKGINNLIKSSGRNGIIYYLTLLISTPYSIENNVKYEELSKIINHQITSPFFEGILFEALTHSDYNCDISKLNLNKNQLLFIQHLLGLYHGEFLPIQINQNDIPFDDLLHNFFEDPHYSVSITKKSHPSPIYAVRWTNPILSSLPQLNPQLPLCKLFEEFTIEELDGYIEKNEIETIDCIDSLHIICKRKPKLNKRFFNSVNWSEVIKSSIAELKIEDINYVCPFIEKCSLSFISFNFLSSFVKFIVSTQKNVSLIQSLFLQYFNTFTSLEDILSSNAFFNFIESRASSPEEYYRIDSLILIISNKYQIVSCKYVDFGRKGILPLIIQNETLLLCFIQNNSAIIKWLNDEYKKSSLIVNFIVKAIKGDIELIGRFKTNPLMMIDIASNTGVNALNYILNEELFETVQLYLKYKEEENPIVSLKPLQKQVNDILSGFVDSNKSDEDEIRNDNNMALIEQLLNSRIDTDEFCNEFELMLKDDTEHNKSKATLIIQFLCDGLVHPPQKGSSVIGDVIGELLKRKIIKGVLYLHIIRIIIAQLDDFNKQSFFPALIALKKLRKSNVICGGIAKTLRNYYHINQINPEMYAFINAQCNKPRVSEMDILKSLINDTFFSEPIKSSISKTIQYIVNGLNEGNLKGIGKDPKDEISIFIVAIHSTLEQQKKLISMCDIPSQIEYCTTAIQHNHFNKISHIDHCIGIGKWLGNLTLNQNKPILMVQLNLKPFIISKCKAHSIEGVGFFLVNVLKGIKGSVFTPQNPWILPLIELLKEMTKLSLPALKQEIFFFFENNNILFENIKPRQTIASLQLNELQTRPLIYIPTEDSVINQNNYIAEIPKSLCTTELTEKEWKYILNKTINCTAKDVIETKKGMIERFGSSIREIILKDIRMMNIPDEYIKTQIPIIICRINSISVIRMIESNIYNSIREYSEKLFHKMILHYLPMCWMEHRDISFDDYKMIVFEDLQGFKEMATKRTMTEIARVLMEIVVDLIKNEFIEKVQIPQEFAFDFPFEKQLALYQTISQNHKNDGWTTSLFDKGTIKLIVKLMVSNIDKTIVELLLNSFINNQNEIVQPKTIKYMMELVIKLEQTSENGINLDAFADIIERIICLRKGTQQLLFVENLFEGTKDLVKNEKIVKRDGQRASCFYRVLRRFGHSLGEFE